MPGAGCLALGSELPRRGRPAKHPGMCVSRGPARRASGSSPPRPLQHPGAGPPGRAATPIGSTSCCHTRVVQSARRPRWSLRLGGPCGCVPCPECLSSLRPAFIVDPSVTHVGLLSASVVSSELFPACLSSPSHLEGEQTWHWPGRCGSRCSLRPASLSSPCLLPRPWAHLLWLAWEEE